MTIEGYARENDPERARAMAEFSDEQHTQAVEMNKEGYASEAGRLEHEAYKSEMQAGSRHDAQHEVEGLDLEALRVKYNEATEAEDGYAKSNLNVGNKDYTKDVIYIQLAQRRAVIEKALHEKEREQA